MSSVEAFIIDMGQIDPALADWAEAHADKGASIYDLRKRLQDAVSQIDIEISFTEGRAA